MLTVTQRYLLMQVARHVVERLEHELAHGVWICYASQLVIYVDLRRVRYAIIRTKHLESDSIPSYEAFARHRNIDDAQASAQFEWAVVVRVHERLRAESHFSRVRNEEYE